MSRVNLLAWSSVLCIMSPDPQPPRRKDGMVSSNCISQNEIYAKDHLLACLNKNHLLARCLEVHVIYVCSNVLHGEVSTLNIC